MVGVQFTAFCGRISKIEYAAKKSCLTPSLDLNMHIAVQPRKPLIFTSTQDGRIEA